MTRDEAYKLCRPFWGNGAMEAIDIWRALGMLKLDEPKDASEQAVDAMFAFPATRGGVIAPRHAIQAIHDAGLKIVSK